MWFNFHTHTQYCDGKSGPADYILSGQKSGLHSLGFSSHAPLPFDCKWCMKQNDFCQYLSHIDRLQFEFPNITLYKGLEVDFVPDIISVHDFDDQLDYSIGSVHFVEQFDDGRRWEIDGPRAGFMEGLHSIFRGDIRAAVTRYQELTRQMINDACPDVVGHLDKIKIQNTVETLFDEADPWYRNEIEKTLQAIRKAGCIVEVNTRGIYRKKSVTTYPGPWILQRIKELNIPITLSSDAHHPDDLINQFPETARLLLEMGFSKITTLSDGSWKEMDFDENGLLLEHT